LEACMANVMNKFEILSTRAGFNSAVRHIKGTISFVESLANKENLADILASSEEAVGAERLAVLLSMLLADKMGYTVCSRNLTGAVEDLAAMAEEFSQWKAVDMVIAYHHPDLGLVVANPKSASQLAAFGALRKRELAVVYAGRFDKGADALCAKAASLALDLLEGVKQKIPQELYKGEFVFKKPKPAKTASPKAAPKSAAKGKRGRKPAAAAAIPQMPAAAPVAVSAPAAAPAPRGAMRMTPMYSVVVQNELFHNGNVEAWKRIINSYKTKHPGLEVFIYYEGERIMDINALFKWGKVKHGSSIQFAVAGDAIADVAKLQRYLNQGASHQFEAFLHGPVSTALKLF
jgi:hypothetical protein